MAYYNIISHAGTGNYLNLAASGPISRKTNVSIWKKSCPIDQIWSIDQIGTKQLVKTINNLSYMLNAALTSGNCDVYTQNADSYVNFELVSTGIYYIRLNSDTSRYLTADGTADGSNVSWATLSTSAAGKKAQQWKLVKTSTPAVYTRVGAGIATLGESQMKVNAQYIWTYLAGKGFTKNAVCGILGNMQCESTINPAAWQSMDNVTGGYGLVQWDDGKRFIDWAKAQGIIPAATAAAVNSLAYSDPVKLMNAELDFLIVEMGDPAIWYTPHNNESKYGTTETLTGAQFKVSTKNAGLLARIFCGHYERPAAPVMSDRVNAADKWYRELR